MASPRVSYSAARTQSTTILLCWEGDSLAHPSERLRWARKMRGWTQEDLANQSGVSQATLTKLERGVSPSRVQSWKLIAKALNVPLDSLLPDPSIDVIPALSKN